MKLATALSTLVLLSANTAYATHYYTAGSSDEGYETSTSVNRPRHHSLRWVDMSTGDPLPMNAVVGGGQPSPRATLYICRAEYRNGLHPGKLYKGRCNIGWGGREVSLTDYQVLTSNVDLNWIADSFGHIPNGAIEGGEADNTPLFICQARYHGGMHPGKIWGENCNIGWGGDEITLRHYNVLVR